MTGKLMAECMMCKPWCMIGGLAVNHWADEPMATADINLDIATDRIEETVKALELSELKKLSKIIRSLSPEDIESRINCGVMQKLKDL